MLSESSLLVWLYGAVFICSSFLIVSFGRILLREGRDCDWELVEVREPPLRWFRRLGWGDCWRNPTWVVALGMVFQSAGLWGISLNRTMDGFAGISIGGTEPLIVAIGLVNLFIGKLLFQWAGTVRNRRIEWWLFLVVQVAWFGLAAWWLV